MAKRRQKYKYSSRGKRHSINPVKNYYRNVAHVSRSPLMVETHKSLTAKSKTATPTATSAAKQLREVFYASDAWRKVRYKVLLANRGACMCCKSADKTLHVDYIKPRFKFPELELEFDNLQVLCEDCNLGKGAWDQTDWRPKNP